MHSLSLFRRGRAATWLATLALAAATGACSSDAEPRDACTALEPGGALVTAETNNEGEPAPPTGGTLVEGTYELEALTVYAPSGTLVVSFCEAFSGVLELREERIESALGCYGDAEDDDSLDQTLLHSGRYRIDGSELSFDYSCPVTEVEVYAYSADAASLRLVAPDLNDPELTIEQSWALR